MDFKVTVSDAVDRSVTVYDATNYQVKEGVLIMVLKEKQERKLIPLHNIRSISAIQA